MKARQNIFYIYIFQLPKDTNEWKAIGNALNVMWIFSHCLDDTDDKHVNVSDSLPQNNYFWHNIYNLKNYIDNALHKLA